MANEDTQKLIDQVEESTGYRITLGTSESATGDAEMISAAKSHPTHIINISTKSLEYADYLTAVQCVMLLTMWTHPLGIPEFRPDPAKLAYAKKKAVSWKGLSKLPRSTADQYASQIVMGLLHQLRSTPSELIAVEHIYKNCPTLRDQQNQIVSRNIRQYTQSMKPNIRAMTPPNIYEGNQIMCGALAKLWCDLTGSNLPMLPYKSIGLESRINAFMDMYYAKDVSMGEKIILTVDEWAEELKLRTQYTWTFRSTDNE
jgi:hypothetical protein